MWALEKVNKTKLEIAHAQSGLIRAEGGSVGSDSQ